MVTCEIKLFQNCFSLCRRPSEIILFQRLWKLAWNYFKIISQAYCSWWIFFQHVHCRWNNFISVSDVVTCEMKDWNNFEIMELFQCFVSAVISCGGYTWNKKNWNDNFKIISKWCYFTCNHGISYCEPLRLKMSVIMCFSLYTYRPRGIMCTYCIRHVSDHLQWRLISLIAVIWFYFVFLQ